MVQERTSEIAEAGNAVSVIRTCPVSAIRQGEPLPANVGTPPGGPSPWPWAIPQIKRMRPTKAALRDHYDPLFPDFETELSRPASRRRVSPRVRRVCESEGKRKELPQFTLLYLPTTTLEARRLASPRAGLCRRQRSRGRARGRCCFPQCLLDDAAIFILEDDAQDGADHVDAHRSIAFVISKYARALRNRLSNTTSIRRLASFTRWNLCSAFRP